ncbi:hypothetical protein [Pseudoalteromonas marina]|uniref:hypothetical protein n=1 Tax=Pseudoalteromonas marina TaxID=267375 RepID=UPI003C5ECA40
MAINDLGTRDQYTATASQTVFPYTFEIFDDDDIAVEQNGTLLTKGTHYTVSGVNVDTGGNITLVTGATSGDILTIYRNMALERVTDYHQNGDFLAPEINNDLDRLWAAMQQIFGNSSLGIRPSTSDTILNSSNTILANPATRGGKSLGFDAAGALEYKSVSVVDGDTKYTTLTTMINDTTATVGTSVYVVSDRANGIFDTVTVGTTPNVDLPNTYNIIVSAIDPTKCFVLRLNLPFDVRKVGVTLDGSTDDGAAMQHAWSLGPCFASGGTCLHATTLDLLDGQWFRGRGDFTFEYTGSGYAIENPNKLTGFIDKLDFAGFDILCVNAIGGLDLEGVSSSKFHIGSIRGNTTTPVAGSYAVHTGWSAGSTGEPSYWLDLSFIELRGFDEIWRADPNSNGIRFLVQRIRTPVTTVGINIAAPSGGNVSSGIDFTVLDIGNTPAPTAIFCDGRNVRGFMRHEDDDSAAIHLGVNHRAVNLEYNTTDTGVEVILDNQYVDGILRRGTSGSATYEKYEGYEVTRMSVNNQSEVVRDNFMGSSLDAQKWTSTVSTNGSAGITDSTTGSSALELSTGGVGGAEAEDVQFSVAPIRSAARNPSQITTRVRLNDLTQVHVQFGFKRDSDALPLTSSLSGVYFENDAAGSAVNWFGVQSNGSTEETGDTSILATATTHVFQIHMDENGRGKFYIDGLEVADLTSSGGNSVNRMVPFFYIAEKEAADKSLEVESFIMKCDIASYT